MNVLGSYLSEEHKDKIRLAIIGRHTSEKTKKKISKALKGRKVSPETRQKMRLAKKGKRLTEEHKKNISLAHIGMQSDEKHHLWRGDDVKYRALHAWIIRKLGKPQFCEFCSSTNLGNRKYHWANKSGNYLRNLNDWIRLCVTCHKVYDNNRRRKLKYF